MNTNDDICEGNRTTKRAETYDAYHNLIFLLDSINKFEPREEWIIPILKSRECEDFKNQLLTTIEHYAKKAK